MKNILLSVLFITISFSIQAQDGAMAKKIETQKIAYITNAMNLSPEESQQFWPLYNQFTDKLKSIRKEGKTDKKLEDMDESDADTYIKQQLDKEAKILDLKKEYTTKYKKVISAKKIALLYKAEREFKGELLNTINDRKRNHKGNPEKKHTTN